VIRPIVLAGARGYEWEADSTQTAIVLPGAILGGTPSCYYVALTLHQCGWRVVQDWSELDRSRDRAEWANERAEAALAYAGDAQLIVAKSATTLATSVAATNDLPGIWLTPLLAETACVEGLRARTAPALLVGGTADASWDGPLARRLSNDVLEIDGADHALARITDLRPLVDAIGMFADRLQPASAADAPTRSRP
jgi:hypothetical protein